MKIAILGTRGIPANYGGFETFAEQLGTRLAARGHEITVYGRKHYSTTSAPTYNGVNLVILPTIRHKYFDTVIHTFLSVLHATPRRYDAILICNAANSVFAFIPRLFGTPTLVNVDGLERKRKKWNWIGRQYYLISEWLSTFLPTAIVTDAQVIQEYYATRYKKESEMIAYGAEVARRADPERLLKFGLQPNRYTLYVSRLEPENNAHLVIEAYGRVKTDQPLVIVGDAPYAEDYIARLKSAKDHRVKFLGFVVGDAGVIYKSAEDLTVCLQRVIDDPTIIGEYRHRAMTRVIERYNWERITDRYEELLARLAGVKIPAGRPAPADSRSYPLYAEESPKAKSATENIP